jgi:hypothetical protein
MDSFLSVYLLFEFSSLKMYEIQGIISAGAKTGIESQRTPAVGGCCGI